MRQWTPNDLRAAKEYALKALPHSFPYAASQGQTYEQAVIDATNLGVTAHRIWSALDGSEPLEDLDAEKVWGEATKKEPNG